jgi:hypothetical protein
MIFVVFLEIFTPFRLTFKVTEVPAHLIKKNRRFLVGWDLAERKPH